ncbi:hypothetical protein ACE3MZ_01515 [Paenibacillus sp. WLX1005]|uniref:hypothetical protein n=1 Tax=unclassified Paenibacillus TaxID=185978 RepID=UPI003984279F
MDILAYVCIGAAFLFVGSRLLLYAIRRKKTPDEQELEQLLLDAVNHKQGK